jgi:hypothetical protein
MSTNKNQTFQIREETPEETSAALQSFFAASRKSAQARDAARERLTAAAPILTRAIRGGSGQGVKVRAIVWSCWNGSHFVGLCDVLCGLDVDIADAVVSLIYARAHLSGDADELIREILCASGEWDAMERAGERVPEGCDFVYPLPLHSLPELRSTVRTMEALQTSGKRAA